jgi:hypothetical protein
MTIEEINLIEINSWIILKNVDSELRKIKTINVNVTGRIRLYRSFRKEAAAKAING